MNPFKRVLSYPKAISAAKAERDRMAVIHEQALAHDQARDRLRTNMELRSYTSADYERDKARAEGRSETLRRRLQSETDYHLNGWNKKDPIPLGDDVMLEMQSRALRAMWPNITHALPAQFASASLAGPEPEFYVDQSYEPIRNPGRPSTR